MVLVKQFEINKDNKLVLCNGNIVIDKAAVHKIEFSRGTTQIETEWTKIVFSPMFTDSTLCCLWEWMQDRDLHIICKHAVSEIFPWVTDEHYLKFLARKYNI